MSTYTYKCDECENCDCINEEDKEYTEQQHNESLKEMGNEEEPNMSLL